MFVWGLLLMTGGLLFTLDTWLGSNASSGQYVLTIAPCLVGLVIAVRAARLLSRD